MERVNQFAGDIQDSNELVGQLQKYRHRTIIQHKPWTTLVMVASMVIVFVFKKKLALMENMIYGNATSVFRDNREDLSKLSKAENINQNLHEKRLVHGKIGRIE